MRRIYLVPVPHTEEKESTDKEYKEAASKALPEDWAFMEQSGKVLEDLPKTWKAYPNTEEGMMGIIKMEYGELQNAQTVKDKMHELVHLASACLHLWRHYHATERPE